MAIEVKTITKKMLFTYCNIPTLERSFALPFSDNKLRWILENPSLEEEDPCFVIGLENKELLTIVQVQADTFINKKQKTTKGYWMLWWWAAAAYEHNVLSTYTFTEALRQTKNQVVIKAYAEHVNDFYNKQPFQVIQKRERHTFFFELPEAILLQKAPILKKLRWTITLVNKGLRFYLKAINSIRSSKHKGTVSGIKIEQIDTQLFDFLKSYLKEDIVPKDKRYLNWQLDSRQYLNETKKEADNSSLKMVAFYKNKTLAGFTAFVLKNKDVYLKYFIGDNDTLNFRLKYLMEELYHSKTSSLFTDNQEVALKIQESYAYLYKHSTNKKALIHTAFSSAVTGQQLSEQDGHFI